LTKLKRAIERDGYELTIPLEHFLTYYNLPIIECQFSKSKILIKIKIPIQEKSAKWKLYQYIPTRFKLYESTCIIYSEKTSIPIISINNEHRIISGIGLQHCDPPITDLCYIPKFSSDITLPQNAMKPFLKIKNYI